MQSNRNFQKSKVYEMIKREEKKGRIDKIILTSPKIKWIIFKS